LSPEASGAKFHFDSIALGDEMQRRKDAVSKSRALITETIPADLLEAVHCALRPYERAENSARQKWGSVARLVSLVPLDLAARYGSALDKMLGAVRRNESQAVAERVAVVIRGLAALDKAADAAQALPPGFIGVNHNRQDYVVALDRLDLPAVQNLVGPGFIVVSLQELIEARSIVLTERDSMALEAIKQATGGNVVAIRGKDSLNDSLPF
jgi:hypothetical protein